MSTVASTPSTDAEATVERAVRRRPWLQTLARAGWGAKGIVYVLMGGLALTLAVRHHTSDAASPEGALGLVAAQPGGRLFLAVLSVGLVLYVVWRVISIIFVDGHDVHAVLDRIGYGFSAAFYAVLAYTAFRDVVNDTEPNDSYTVERLSRSLLSHPVGRVLMVVAGIVVITVGVYFVVRGLRRDFADGLRGVQRTWPANHGVARLIYVTGFIGWVGRGVVTALVGFFVARAALRFDPNDASGFDRAFRRLSESQPGAMIVGTAGCFVILYGLYCLLSAPRRTLAEPSS